MAEGEHGHPWIEFRLGDSSLMVFKVDTSNAAGCDHEPWVYVDDIEGHYRHATEGGAKILEPIRSPWGLAFYLAEDLEGHRWRFVQARPTML